MNKKMLLTLFFSAFFLSNSVASNFSLDSIKKDAESFPNLDLSSSEKCFDSVNLGGMKNNQRIICTKLDFLISDKKLNENYQKLIKLLSRQQGEYLKKSQISWIKYRDDWCDFSEITSDEILSKDLSRIFCLADNTKEKSNEMKELIDFLEDNKNKYK